MSWRHNSKVKIWIWVIIMWTFDYISDDFVASPWMLGAARTVGVDQLTPDLGMQMCRMCVLGPCKSPLLAIVRRPWDYLAGRADVASIVDWKRISIDCSTGQWSQTVYANELEYNSASYACIDSFIVCYWLKYLKNVSSVYRKDLIAYFIASEINLFWCVCRKK